VQYAENPQRLAPRRIDDEVREHFVKEHVLARQIGAAVPNVWNFRQPVKGLEEFGDNAVRNFLVRLV